MSFAYEDPHATTCVTLSHMTSRARMRAHVLKFNSVRKSRARFSRGALMTKNQKITMSKNDEKSCVEKKEKINPPPIIFLYPVTYIFGQKGSNFGPQDIRTKNDPMGSHRVVFCTNRVFFTPPQKVRFSCFLTPPKIDDFLIKIFDDFFINRCFINFYDQLF